MDIPKIKPCRDDKCGGLANLIGTPRRKFGGRKIDSPNLGAKPYLFVGMECRYRCERCGDTWKELNG